MAAPESVVEKETEPADSAMAGDDAVGLGQLGHAAAEVDAVAEAAGIGEVGNRLDGALVLVKKNFTLEGELVEGAADGAGGFLGGEGGAAGEKVDLRLLDDVNTDEDIALRGGEVGLDRFEAGAC